MSNKWTFVGIFAHLDGTFDLTGDSFAPNCEVKIAKNISIMHEFQGDLKHRLGNAQVFKEKDQLKYKLDISGRQLPKELLNQLTPCLGGNILKRDGNIVKSIEITCVGLCLNPADKRLKPLMECQINESNNSRPSK